MYTTLSPCALCSGSILLYGIPQVVTVGENRTFLGEEDLLRSRGVKVEVLDDPRCRALMAEFVVLIVCALSASASLFLILELNRPLEGMIKASRAPMVNALQQLGR